MIRSRSTWITAAALLGAVSMRAEAQAYLFCTPGAIRACGGFEVSLSGGDLTLKARSLEGFGGMTLNDNTGGSIIFGISANFGVATGDAGGFAAGTNTAGAMFGPGMTAYGPNGPWRWNRTSLTNSIETSGSFENSYLEGVNATSYRGAFATGTWSASGNPLSGVNLANGTSFTFLGAAAGLTTADLLSIGFVAESGSGFYGCNVAGSDTYGWADEGACVVTEVMRDPGVIPEPASVVLMATGMIGLAGAGWARRRNS